jgi:hypothetical protein
MHPRTVATLSELEKAEWFRSVGVQDTQAADILHSWPEAVRSCSCDQWQDLLLEAANAYCMRLLEHSPSRYERWNIIVSSIKPIALDLVDRKLRCVVQEHSLPKVFVDTVQWDILHLCMEAEYADVYPPGFFASQGFWYVNGHFPCGWAGDFPRGNLVVYWTHFLIRLGLPSRQNAVVGIAVMVRSSPAPLRSAS